LGGPRQNLADVVAARWLQEIPIRLRSAGHFHPTLAVAYQAVLGLTPYFALIASNMGGDAELPEE